MNLFFQFKYICVCLIVVVVVVSNAHYAHTFILQHSFYMYTCSLCAYLYYYIIILSFSLFRYNFKPISRLNKQSLESSKTSTKNRVRRHYYVNIIPRNYSQKN